MEEGRYRQQTPSDIWLSSSPVGLLYTGRRVDNNTYLLKKIFISLISLQNSWNGSREKRYIYIYIYREREGENEELDRIKPGRDTIC